MVYKYLSESATEPITLSEAKTFLKVDTSQTEEDTYISGLITVARQMAELNTRRKLISAVVEGYADYFEDFKLNVSPISAINSVKYYDSNNDLQTFSDYDTDLVSEPARITLRHNATYPTTYIRTNAVIVNFTAGYTTVPKPLLQAMYLLIGHFFENREQVVVGSQVNELPMAYDNLIFPYRVFVF